MTFPLLFKLEKILSHVTFSYWAFAIYVFPSMISVPLRMPTFDYEPRETFQVLIIGITVTFATGLLLFLGLRLVDNLFRGNPWSVLPILLIVGAVRGLLLHLAFEFVDIGNYRTLLASLISSSFFTTFYFISAANLVAVLKTNQKSFVREFQRVVSKVSKTPPERVSWDDYLGAMVNFKTAIDKQVEASPRTSDDRLVTARVATEIQKQVEELIKPLSQRLWLSSVGQLKRRNNFQILKDAIKDIHFPIPIVITYQILGGIFGLLIAIGFGAALIKTIFSLSGVLLVWKTYDFIRAKDLGSWQLRGSFFYFGIGFIPIFLAETVSYGLGLPVYPTLSILLMPALPGLILLLSVVEVINSDRKMALSAMTVVAHMNLSSGTTDTAPLNSEELSRYLHNDLQNELLLISRQLGDLKYETDKQQFHLLLQQLYSTLARSASEIDELRYSGFEKLRKSIIAWKGIAEILLSIDSEDSIPAHDRFILAELLQEFITNCIRHGQAKSIKITLNCFESIARLTIEHDGRGEIKSSEGLGERIALFAGMKEASISRHASRTTIQSTYEYRHQIKAL
jgi:signal transduction histidine kinase